MNGDATRQGYDYRHTPRSGQHRYVRVAYGSGYSKVERLSHSIPPMLMATPLPALTVSANAPSALRRQTLYRLRRNLAVIFTPTNPSCPVRPSAPAYAFRPRPAHHRSSPTAPTSGEIGAAAKSKSANGILTFTAAISPHIGSVGSAYNATENEVGAVGTKRAVGGLKRRTRGAAPYPVIAYKSIL